jgi:hypothetical protein
VIRPSGVWSAATSKKTFITLLSFPCWGKLLVVAYAPKGGVQKNTSEETSFVFSNSAAAGKGTISTDFKRKKARVNDGQKRPQDEKVRADQTPFEPKRRQAANANEQWWTRESQE